MCQTAPLPPAAFWVSPESGVVHISGGDGWVKITFFLGMAQPDLNVSFRDAIYTSSLRVGSNFMLLNI